MIEADFHCLALHKVMTRAFLSLTQNIAEDDPVLLLAHCWAQYAALLAGEPFNACALSHAVLPHCLINLLACLLLQQPRLPIMYTPLAGGQIIQRMVRRALQLGIGPGTAAFTFAVRSSNWPSPVHCPGLACRHLNAKALRHRRGAVHRNPPMF